MYKTVRKGDASLQYTILPQNEQFYNNPTPPPPSPPLSLFERIIVKIYKIYAIVIITMAACTFLIFLALLPGLFYDGHSNSVNKVLLIDQQLEPKINESRAEKATGDDDIKIPSTMTSEDFASSSVTELEDEPSPTFRDDSEGVPNTNATTEIIKITYSSPKIDTLVSQSSEMNLENTETTSYPSSSLDPITSTADYEKTSSDESPPASTVKSSTVPSSFKKAKMPKITLRLRENETIPQMYMKAGIASYKKGNITTSVLAHGLSLERLIFKTPEGTIKPWSEKWPFSESSTYVQWKRDDEMREQIFAVLVTLMAVSVMIFCVLSLAQLKASRKRWQNVEEPPLKGRDDEESEDRSKLLGGEDKEEDKE